MRIIFLAILGTLTLLICAGAVGYCWWERPTVSVERLGGRVVVHAELLGEYPSDIGLIEVTEAASSKSVWRVVPEGEKVQMHSFALKVGENGSSPAVFWGRFRSADKGDARPFILKTDVTYVVRVCAPTAIPLCTSRAFMLT